MDPRLVKIKADLSKSLSGRNASLNASLNDLLVIIDGLLVPPVVPPVVPPIVPPVVTGLPDPLKLPAATKAQAPVPLTYDLLHVPALLAGKSYNDPVTGVKVYKLTSPNWPSASSAGYGHDYAEGGDEISLPHSGLTRTILIRDLSSQGWWLVDFTPGNPATVENARPLTGNLVPSMDLAFTFSNNPRTPELAYVATAAGVIRRFDVRSMLEVPGDGWPVVDFDTSQQYGYPCWLHQAIDDSFFCWMRGPNGPTVVGYEPATRRLKAHTDAAVNEPRIDRGGRFIALACNPPMNSLKVWDWLNDTITWSTLGDTGSGDTGQIPFAHNASLRRRWVGGQWNMGFPYPFWKIDPSVPNSSALCTGTGPGNPIHGNGNWVQPNAALDDQWALFNMYGATAPTDLYAWLAPGAMLLMTPAGQRRIVAHTYNSESGQTYGKLSFAKFSPDGRFVMFTSNQNGSPRSDVFLAEMPVS